MGCDEGPDVEFNNLNECITEVSIQASQGGRTANRAATVSNGSVSVTLGDWIDWGQPVTIVVRIIGTLDNAECRALRGTEIVPMAPFDERQPEDPVAFDMSVSGTAPPPPTGTAPPACNVNITFKDERDAGAHGGVYRDFAQAGDPAAPPLIDFTPTGGTGPGKLGYARGQYIDPNTGIVLGYGYFKKTEVHITVDAPCVITGVLRTKQTLPGHNFTPAEGATADGPNANRSVTPVTPQHWVVTDAPGMAVGQQDGANGKVYHRRMVITANGLDGGNPPQPWTATKTYDVWVGVDGNGRLLTPPPSHNR